MMNQILSSVTACLYTTFSSKTIYCVYHFRKEELIKNKLSWQILLTGWSCGNKASYKSN